MVKGLEKFKKHFNPYFKDYILIGGTACWLAMEQVGLKFRTTKDLDIVLSIEVLNDPFVKALREFITHGKYHYRQKSSGKKQLFRFHSPAEQEYPYMLELFSRKPDGINLFEDSKFTPLLIEDEMTSLSAILLDEEYYHFILKGRQEIGGLSVLSPGYLIPMKARAWLNLSSLPQNVSIDDQDIRKHKNDIIRLYPLLKTNVPIPLPEAVKKDMHQFLGELEQNPPDLKNLGLKYTNIKDIISGLNQIYFK